MLEKCIKYISKSNVNELKELLGFCNSDDDNFIISNIENINQISKKGFIPIHLACQIQNIDILQLLLKCKDIDINIRNPINSFTPIITLINYGGNIECLNLILKRKPNLLLCDEEYGDSPLHWAVKLELPYVIHRLVKSGLDVNLINKKTGYTPLYLGILNRSEQVVNELISLSANPIFEINDLNGNSSLHLCILKNMPNLVFNIFKSSTKEQKEKLKNSIDKNGNTALHLALIHNMFALADFLIKEGFSIHLKNFQGYTPNDLKEKFNNYNSNNSNNSNNYYKNKKIINQIIEIKQKNLNLNFDDYIYQTQVSKFIIQYKIAEKSYFDEINNNKIIGKHEFLFKLFYKHGFHNLDSNFKNLTISDLTSIGIKDKKLKNQILNCINTYLNINQVSNQIHEKKTSFKKKKNIAYLLITISTCIFIFFITYIILNAIINNNSISNQIKS